MTIKQMIVAAAVSALPVGSVAVAADGSANAQETDDGNHHQTLKGAAAGAAIGHVAGHHAVAGAVIGGTAGAIKKHHDKKVAKKLRKKKEAEARDAAATH